MNLQGKTAFITGASAGIGAACAEVFAESGANLVLIARRKEKVDIIGKKLAEKNGIKCYTAECDVRNFNDLKKVVNKLPEDFKKVDILVNNAGKALGMDKIQDGHLDDWDEMIDTNIKGLLYATRLIVPGMVERGDGIVINIGSIAGREIYPSGNVYCGSKAAVRAISKGMVIDLNGTGVRVTNIDPGLVETEFSEVRFHGDEEKAKKVYVGYKPLTAMDIADLALFCATRPQHVTIQDVLITPTDQATTTLVNKKL